MNRLLGLEQGLSRQSAKTTKRRRRKPAKTRALSRASKLSEALYGTGEHVRTGKVDLSSLGSIGPTTKLDVNGVLFTYGQIIAMADMYETHGKMVNAPRTELTKLRQLIDKSTRFFEGKGGSDASRGEWQSATNRRYLKLAEDNFSHFAPSSSHLIPGYSSTKVNSRTEWERYHQQAINTVKSGTNSEDMDDALVMNAFGDHFLTDAFAAGHLFNKDDLNSYFKSRVFSGKKLNSNGSNMLSEIARKAFKGPLKAAFSKYETYEPHEAWWNIFSWNPNIHNKDRFEALLKGIMLARPDIIGKSIVAKAVHYKLNDYKGGIPVADARRNHWNLTGDDTLDDENLSYIQEAVLQSITNLLDVADGKSIPSATLFGRVWDMVPRPTTSSRKLIKNLIKKLTNPLDSELTDIAAELLTKNFDDLLIELKNEKILKKA